jgi:GTPase-activating protein SAC7
MFGNYNISLVQVLPNAMKKDLGYGSNHEWDNDQYNVRDAATLLLRYLRLLPEPVVPYKFYPGFEVVHEKIAAITSNDRAERWSSVENYALAAISLLPRENRHLLLYLLDLIRVLSRPTFERQLTLDTILVDSPPGLILSHERSLMRRGGRPQDGEVIRFLVEFFQNIPSSVEFYSVVDNPTWDWLREAL